MIEHYINPTFGEVALRSIRTEHIDNLYASLLERGGRAGNGLAPKTVHEVHVIIRSALNDAVDCGLLRINAATKARPPRSQSRPRTGPVTWSAMQLTEFLQLASRQRLYPTLHLAAATGMRRGEIAGLRWSDWNQTEHRLSINRSRQVVAGRSTEFAPKTRPVDAVLTSTPPPRPTSAAGTNVNMVTVSQPAPTIRSLPTPPATRSTPSQSVSSSTAPWPAASSRA